MYQISYPTYHFCAEISTGYGLNNLSESFSFLFPCVLTVHKEMCTKEDPEEKILVLALRHIERSTVINWEFFSDNSLLPSVFGQMRKSSTPSSGKEK